MRNHGHEPVREPEEILFMDGFGSRRKIYPPDTRQRDTNTGCTRNDRFRQPAFIVSGQRQTNLANFVRIAAGERPGSV